MQISDTSVSVLCEFPICGVAAAQVQGLSQTSAGRTRSGELAEREAHCRIERKRGSCWQNGKCIVALIPSCALWMPRKLRWFVAPCSCWGLVRKPSQVGSSIQRESIRQLLLGHWLNDRVIHCFHIMLAKRDEKTHRADPSRKRSHFFKSFFVTSLQNMGDANPDLNRQCDCHPVKNWSKNVPGEDVFKLWQTLLPDQSGTCALGAGCGTRASKRVQLCDSMGGKGTQCLQDVFQCIQDEHMDKKKVPLPDVNEWALVECTDDMTHQENGASTDRDLWLKFGFRLTHLDLHFLSYHCGIFTCVFADFLSSGYLLIFEQEHVNRLHERIALSVLKGRAQSSPLDC
jgi:hypothetical protein